MKNLTDQEVETITDSLHSRREEILKTLLNEFDDNSIVLELVEDLKKVEALYNRFIQLMTISNCPHEIAY